ncbi:MAG: right-handed parallel beta-helix repeat-containing protein [Methanomassiliicoccales archaeon]|nr:MAG: right-handed parallel beta-helix repeat-containing protein [Methanomassiliicoccales archaeon]
MKRTILLLGILAVVFAMLFAFNSNAAAADSPTPVYVQPGQVSGTWTNDNVYYVTGDIQVAEGETLTIEEGTTILFDNGAILAVDGTLVADGAGNGTIIFGANSSTPWVGYWDGIVVNSTGVATLKNVNITYAYISLFVKDGTIAVQDVYIADTYIGVRIIESEAETNLTLSDITIDNYWTYGIHVRNLDQAIRFSLSDSEMENGNSADGVMIEAGDDLNGTVYAAISNVKIDGGLSAVNVLATLDIQLLVVDCTFTAQEDVSVAADSLFGSVELVIDGSIIDGSNSNDDSWIYTMTEIEYEFEVIPYDSEDENQTTSNEMLVAELPFDFVFSGVSIDQVFMTNDYLYLQGGYVYPAYNSNVEVNGGSTFYGFKVYDDRAVFQWSQSLMYENSRLNLYEVILWANGDIQLNYNVMESTSWSAINLVTGYYNYVISDLIGSASDQDYRSYLLSGQSLSPGTGVTAVTLLGEVTITMTDSTISSFDQGAIYALSEEGYVMFEMSDSEISWINNYDYEGAVNLLAYYGAVDVLVQNNYFYQVYDMVFYIESYMEEPDDVFVDILDNEFVKCFMVAYVGTWVNIADSMENTSEMLIRTSFNDNMLLDSGAVYFYTSINLFDEGGSDVTIEEEYMNNTFETVLFIGDLPLLDWSYWDASMFKSETNYYSYDSVFEDSLTKQVTVTGNEFSELPGLPFWDDGGILFHYPNAFDVSTSLWFSGEQLTADISTTIMDNIVAIEESSSSGPLVNVASYLNTYEGDVGISESVIVSDNTLVDETIESFGVLIDSEAYFGLNNVATKESSIEGVYVVEDNYLEGMIFGARIALGREVENVAGDITISDAVRLNRNTVVNSGPALYIEMDNDFGFYDYFPYASLYEGGEIVQNVEYNVDVEVMDNSIECVYSYDWYGAIYIDLYTDIWNPGNTLLTDPSVIGTTSIAVSGNQVQMSNVDIDAIEIYQSAYAGGRDSVSNITSDIVVVENVIAGNYFDHGIYVEVGNDAYTEYERNNLLDSPVSILYATVEISDNMVDCAQYGIEMYLWTEAYLGAAMEYTTFNGMIVNNMVYNSTYAGIAAYVDVYMINYYECMSQTNDTVSITVAQNTVDNELDETYGIYVETYYYWWYYYDQYAAMTGTMSFVIEDNDVSNAYCGIYVDVYDESLLTTEVYVLDNTIWSVYYYGIEAYADHLTITGNIVNEGWNYGIYVGYSSGVISDNQVSWFDDCGIYVYDGWDMVISDNSVTYCGLDDEYGVLLEYIYNVTFSNNVITNNQWGLYVYNAEASAIISNVIEKNTYGGAYFYEIFETVIESNSFSENGGDGAVFYYGYDFVIGNNTFEKNLGFGLYMDIGSGRGYLYNNEFSYNGEYGLYAYSYGGIWLGASSGEIDHSDEWHGLIWIVDEQAIVLMNSVEFYGELKVLEGGHLKVESAEAFCFGESSVDGTPSLIVEGTMDILNTYMYAYEEVFEFEIYGTVSAELSVFEAMKQVYIAEGSTAVFRKCEFKGAWLETIFIDNASPMFSMCTMVGASDRAVVWIQGPNANPTITGGIILGGMQGIYAKDASIGNVYDTIFAMNYMAGIYGEGVTGKIHDNVFMLNGVAIMLKDSDVSIEDNEIGWTMYMDALAKYAPVLELVGHHFFEMLPYLEDLLPFILSSPPMDDPMVDLIGTLMQVGVYAEDSDIEMSGNTYGMLYQCVYLNGGTLSFSDKIEMRMLEVPYFIGLNTSSMQIMVQNVNGLYAVNADVVVDGATISVVDDAIVLENCDAKVLNSTLDAGDFDIYAMAGSEVEVRSTVMEKVKSEDSNTITVWYFLEVTAVDDEGAPVEGRTVKVYNAAGDLIAEGKTDANGKFTTEVVAYKVTDAGKSAAETYKVKVDFKNGEVSTTAAVTEPVTMVEVAAEKDNTAMYVGLAVVAVAVLLIAVALLMRARKK